jgi:hypothetical protein
MKALEHVQELDLKIEGLKKNKNSLPAALKTLDDSLCKLKAQVDTKKNTLGEMEKVMKQTKAALELNRDRMSRSTARLDAVQNSQEFQAITKEIEQGKKLNGSLEEQEKKTAGEMEVVSKELATLTAEMDKLQVERDSQASVVTGKTSQFDMEIASLTAERGRLTSQVEARILAQYDRVRAARGGLGLVPAVGGRCKGCNMVVPPQLYNEVQKGNAIQCCPSCHRILFVPAAAAPTESASQSK